MICKCGKTPIENNGLCASCNRESRKKEIKRKYVKIRPISKKRQKQISEYSKLRKEFIESHLTCQVCRKELSTDIHHKQGRENDMLNDFEFWLAVCRPCHSWIHDNPKEAYEKGYLLKKNSK